MDLQAAFSARLGQASVGTGSTEMKSGHSYCVCLSKSEIDLVCKCYGRMSILTHQRKIAVISYLKNWNHFWANKKKEMCEYDVLWSGIVRHALRNAVLPCMNADGDKFERIDLRKFCY